MAHALLLALAVSCGEASNPGFSPRDETVGDGWTAFRAQAVESSVRPGVFTVEGDIAIHGEAALRRYYDEHVARGSQRLTVRLTSSGNDDIWSQAKKHSLTYCISNDFGTRKAAVIAGMAAATESWSRRVGVTFRYLPAEDSLCVLESPDTNPNVFFEVRPAPSSEGYNAQAFFPSYPRYEQSLFIHERAFTTTAGGRTLDGILRHELGHVLGFRHEHIWATPTATCSNPDPAGEDLYSPGHADDARILVGGYDAVSVMHYPECRPVGAVNGYTQSETDYRAAISLYGLAPALIVTVL